MEIIKKIIQIGSSEGITLSVSERKKLDLKKGNYVKIIVKKIKLQEVK